MLTQEKLLPQYHPDKLPVLHAWQKYKHEEKHDEQHMHGDCHHSHGGPDESRKIPVPGRYQAIYEKITNVFSTQHEK